MSANKIIYALIGTNTDDPENHKEEVLVTVSSIEEYDNLNIPEITKNHSDLRIIKGTQLAGPPENPEPIAQPRLPYSDLI